MPKKTKILYVCQEIFPYLPKTDMSQHCRTLVQAMQERGCETRTFMPRFGVIKERHNQLHEVIRLSGMNLIINDNDHQLIIKVASIPAARVQIYFIDNEDHFSRKAILCDPTSGKHFDDNGDRAIFFARGVLETIKELRWQPDIVHCHGWFSDVTPLYLRNAFADDPLFKDVKIVSSLYNDGFEGVLNDTFKETLEKEGVESKNLDIISDPSYQNFLKLVIDNTDGIIVEDEDISAELKEKLNSYGGKLMWNTDKSDENYLDNYHKFYEEILES
ncbi:MAG: glycogen/starch synthase [Tidjanibacter sp.]|nr:glycogen/starch synthase [Tidjanibacter sp.]